MKTVIHTSGKLIHLTKGKNYKVMYEYPQGYVIQNDIEVPVWYGKENFEETLILRKRLIKKLLENDNTKILRSYRKS
jgi:hypothetical protein